MCDMKTWTSGYLEKLKSSVSVGWYNYEKMWSRSIFFLNITSHSNNNTSNRTKVLIRHIEI